MSYLINHLFANVRRLTIEQDGAAASEYAIILGVIIVVVVAAAGLFGMQFSNATSSVYTGLSNGADAAGGSFGPGSFRSQTTVNIP